METKNNKQRGFERGEIMMVAKIAGVTTSTVRRVVDGQFDQDSPTVIQITVEKAIELLKNFKKDSKEQINTFKNSLKKCSPSQKDHVLISE
jgi:hypothetical protein